MERVVILVCDFIVRNWTHLRGSKPRETLRRIGMGHSLGNLCFPDGGQYGDAGQGEDALVTNPHYCNIVLPLTSCPAAIDD